MWYIQKYTCTLQQSIGFWLGCYHKYGSYAATLCTTTLHCSGVLGSGWDAFTSMEVILLHSRLLVEGLIGDVFKSIYRLFQVRMLSQIWELCSYILYLQRSIGFWLVGMLSQIWELCSYILDYFHYFSRWVQQVIFYMEWPKLY